MKSLKRHTIVFAKKRSHFLQTRYM